MCKILLFVRNCYIKIPTSMFSKSNTAFTKSEQDRQRVMKRAENMNADYAKGLSTFDKDHRAKMEAAEQRRLEALKQKVPLAHFCPTSGECEECAEKQRKLKAAMKAMQKAAPKKGAFKKKTLNRQRSHSADDVSMVLTKRNFTKTTTEVGANSQKDSILHKTIQSAKFTMNSAIGGAAYVSNTLSEWMGLPSGKAGSPAVPLAGTAKEAITASSPTASTSSSAESSPEPIKYGDGYVRDTAANFVKKIEEQKPKTVRLTMTQVAGASRSANSAVTSKGTIKDTVKTSQREQKKIRMVMK